MKRTVKQFLCMLLVLAISVSICIVPAAASLHSSLYLDAYRAWLTPRSGGRIIVAVDVQALDFMDEIGAKRIEIFESKNSGRTWTSEKIYLSSTTPGMYITNAFYYYDDPVTYYGTPGYKYYADVTVYAGDSTGSDSRVYSTPVVTAIS